MLFSSSAFNRSILEERKDGGRMLLLLLGRCILAIRKYTILLSS